MTQQYTPVTWQDETTSQQGTLINAERLNQMQTAHHYADGFEEVDAVPAADPGVAYHKIVYCTADSTFYRWDGTEWTKDIDDETKQLLEQEIARATAAEGELAQDLADETTARETADTGLGNRITAETSARTQADTALGGRIDAEATAREGADTTLQEHIDTLAQHTEDALDTKVDKDGAVTSVQGQTGAVLINAGQIPLNAGASTPTVHNAILANQGQIDAVTADLADEVQARTTAVDTLSTRVGALETGLADTYNKSQTDTLLAGKADDSALATLSTRVDTLDAQNVKLTGNQEIEGNKTFTSSGFTHLDIKSSRTTGNIGGISFVDGNGTSISQIYSGTTLGNVVVNLLGSNTPYMEIFNQRAYNPSNTNDVATIGTLDAYTPMVRTSNDQTIGGTKTFTNGVIVKAYQALTVTPTGGPTIGINSAATQNILSLYQRQGDSNFVTRDTIYQGANTRTTSRSWYLQRQNEAGTGIEQISLALSFTAEGRGQLTITDSQGTRTII